MAPLSSLQYNRFHITLHVIDCHGRLPYIITCTVVPPYVKMLVENFNNCDGKLILFVAVNYFCFTDSTQYKNGHCYFFMIIHTTCIYEAAIPW